MAHHQDFEKIEYISKAEKKVTVTFAFKLQ